jgi:hypothetical protein
MSSSFNTPQGIRVFPTIVYVSGSATVDNVSIPRRALGCFRLCQNPTPICPTTPVLQFVFLLSLPVISRKLSSP